jgi:hypothetical protein
LQDPEYALDRCFRSAVVPLYKPFTAATTQSVIESTDVRREEAAMSGSVDAQTFGIDDDADNDDDDDFDDDGAAARHRHLRQCGEPLDVQRVSVSPSLDTVAVTSVSRDVCTISRKLLRISAFHTPFHVTPSLSCFDERTQSFTITHPPYYFSHLST